MGDDEEHTRALSNLRKRRGVVRASITRLTNRLKDFEGAADQPDVCDHVQQLATKVGTLDKNFPFPTDRSHQC